jgi:YihY family inner membrane protein
LRAGRNFLRDHGGSHAAAVAYFSLLSFGPFLLLVGKLIGAILPGEDVAAAVAVRISEFLPPVLAPVLPSLTTKGPAPSGIVAVALPVLVWVASTAFSALELAVNVAFGTTPRRRFLLSRLKAFAAVTGAAVLLAVSLAVRHIADWLDRYREQVGLPPALGPRAHWISYAVLLLLAYAAFTLFYKTLPRGKVSWRAAGSSAVVALVLWEAARRIFGGALLRSPAFGLLTGTLAGIVSFLLWNYTAVAIALYGAETAAILNGNRE